jgi:hypothetical protein
MTCADAGPEERMALGASNLARTDRHSAGHLKMTITRHEQSAILSQAVVHGDAVYLARVRRGAAGRPAGAGRDHGDCRQIAVSPAGT